MEVEDAWETEGIFQTRSGQLFLYGKTGVYEWTDDEWRPYPDDSSYKRCKVFSMAEGSDGTLLLGSDDAVERWQSDQFERLAPEAGDFLQRKILAIMPNSDNTTLFGTSGSGIVEYKWPNPGDRSVCKMAWGATRSHPSIDLMTEHYGWERAIRVSPLSAMAFGSITLIQMVCSVVESIKSRNIRKERFGVRRRMSV